MKKQHSKRVFSMILAFVMAFMPCFTSTAWAGEEIVYQENNENEIIERQPGEPEEEPVEEEPEIIPVEDPQETGVEQGWD